MCPRYPYFILLSLPAKIKNFVNTSKKPLENRK